MVMNNKEQIELEGIVTENLPNTTFRVETPDQRHFLCTLSGKMRMNRIRILPGDRVKFIITPYDQTKGRIVYRLK